MAELGAGSGSGYPGVLDTDNTLESTATVARADVPNDLASAIVAIETELGTDPAGSLTDVKTFLQTEHNTDGTHNITNGGQIIIDVTQAEALLVRRNGDTKDILNVNTNAQPFVLVHNHTRTTQGLGTYTFEVMGTIGANDDINVESYADTANFVASRANGVEYTPTTILTNEIVAEYSAQAHDGTDFVAIGDLRFKTSGTIGTNQIPTHLELHLHNGSVKGERFRFDSKSNLGVGVSSFGTDAVGVIGITAVGTVPTSSPAGMIQIFADDTSDGANNATLAIRTERAVESGAPTMSHKVKVWWNGTEYWLGLDAV